MTPTKPTALAPSRWPEAQRTRRAAAIGDPKIGGELTYPELAFLRDDPRFAAFARRIGVSPP